MKKLIILMSLLASSHSFAGQACNAVYASGIGHVFKGESRPVGDLEKILEGQSTQDELYTVTVKNGQPSLNETKSGKAVTLGSQELSPEMEMYATKSLRLYPSGVPGAFADHRFIIILCADESAFQ